MNQKIFLVILLVLLIGCFMVSCPRESSDQFREFPMHVQEGFTSRDFNETIDLKPKRRLHIHEQINFGDAPNVHSPLNVSQQLLHGGSVKK